MPTQHQYLSVNSYCTLHSRHPHSSCHNRFLSVSKIQTLQHNLLSRSTASNDIFTFPSLWRPSSRAPSTCLYLLLFFFLPKNKKIIAIKKYPSTCLHLPLDVKLHSSLKSPRELTLNSIKFPSKSLHDTLTP